MADVESRLDTSAMSKHVNLHFRGVLPAYLFFSQGKSSLVR